MISGESTESVVDHLRGSLAASAIFVTVFSLQFLSQWLDFSTTKNKGPKSSDAIETRLREEIKQLLKEASALSQPSTFAQAAKLRRSAAAKEKELANHQQSLKKEASVISYNLHRRVVSVSKVVLYFVLICWFWKVPVATVSQQLVQPFGKMLSWKGGGVSDGNVMVGVIPWLILCNRVSKFACRLFKI